MYSAIFRTTGMEGDLRLHDAIHSHFAPDSICERCFFNPSWKFGDTCPPLQTDRVLDRKGMHLVPNHPARAHSKANKNYFFAVERSDKHEAQARRNDEVDKDLNTDDKKQIGAQPSGQPATSSAWVPSGHPCLLTAGGKAY